MKNITVARSWADLNTWQLQEITDLYLSLTEESFEKTFNKMIFVLFQVKQGFFTRLRLRRLLKNIPISELRYFGQFLLEPPKIHRFTNVAMLYKPADRLGDISVKQFSFIDQFFNLWIESKSDLHLRQLCAAVYRTQLDFDEQILPDVAKFTDKLTRKQRQVIGFTYMSCYHYITDRYPVIWPKPKKKEDEEKKVEKRKYTPFSEIIINVAMNENQPLGNYHESSATRLYDFLNVLEKILIQQKQQEEHANRK